MNAFAERMLITSEFTRVQIDSAATPGSVIQMQVRIVIQMQVQWILTKSMLL